MARTLNLWLAAGPSEAAAAAALRLPMAWMLYGVSQGGALRRTQLPAPPRGGLLGLTGPLPEAYVPQALAHSLAAECRRRSFRGVVLDCEGEMGPLTAALTALNIPCFSPIKVESAALLIPSALSGGDFRAMLEAAADGHRGRLALHLTRMGHSFAMPAYPPQGEALTPEALRALMAAHSPTPRFSPEMLCRYFTYRSESGPRFVLFDDVQTARLKIEAAREAGFTDAFVSHHQWGGQARGIFG